MTTPATHIVELRRLQAQRIADCGRAFMLVILIGLIGLLGRIVQLKVAPNPRLGRAFGTSISPRVGLTRRGDLLDRSNRVIATSTVGYRLFVDPQAVADPSLIAVEIGNIIQKDPVDIDRKISERPESRYVVIDHELEDWQVEAIRKANFKGVG